MCGSMADIPSAAAENRRGKKEDRNYRMKIYMVSLLHWATITNYRAKYNVRICYAGRPLNERLIARPSTKKKDVATKRLRRSVIDATSGGVTTG